MTDQRIVNTSVEAETAVRLEAALRHRADADGPALRLNLHRWRVALRSAGQTPSEALLELERVLERWTAVSGSFESQQSAIGSPEAVVADHRSRRAARAAGRTVQLEPLSQPEPQPAAGVAMPRVASEALSQSSGSSAVLPTNSAPVGTGQMSTVQASTVQASTVQVDTVRIPVTKLDALLALSGELRVAQIRAATRSAQLKALLTAMNGERRRWRRRQADPVQLLERFRERTREAMKQLELLERQLTLDNAQLKTLTQVLEDEVLGARLLPAATLLPPLERLVRDLSQQLGKRVRLTASGADVQLDRRIVNALRDPLMHMVRNALDHGIETPQLRAERGKPLEGQLLLHVASDGATVQLDLSDDGAGIDVVAVQRRAVAKGLIDASQPLSAARISELIFEPGFSTAATVTETSGRGVGMDVVRENVTQIGGRIALRSQAGLGSTFVLRLPVQLATSRVLLVRLSDAQLVALPTRDLERTGRVRPSEISAVGGSSSLQFDGQALPVASLGALLGVAAAPVGEWLEYVVLNGHGQRLACAVAALVGEQEIVVKRLSYPLQGLAHLSGAALLGSGELVPILNVVAIFERHAQGGGGVFHAPSASNQPPAEQRRRILVVDDSVTTRTLERSILEAAGFETRTATDGLQALELLRTFNAELVLSDVEMPHLDGFELTEEIRRDPRTQHIPVILVTSLDKPEHKERGALAGADAYIIKGEFNQQTLLETIGRLL